MQYVRIPQERIPVLIGKKGSVKRKIEEISGAKLTIDSETGEVTIDTRNLKDPLFALKVPDVVKAIGRGFSPEAAMDLLYDEDSYLVVIDIKDYSERPNRIRELRGRVIGTGGKTRRLIENLTNSKISVYGHTVSIIGDSYGTPIATNAVEMLLSGRMHASVYSYLERKSREMKMMRQLEALSTMEVD